MACVQDMVVALIKKVMVMYNWDSIIDLIIYYFLFTYFLYFINLLFQISLVIILVTKYIKFLLEKKIMVVGCILHIW